MKHNEQELNQEMNSSDDVKERLKSSNKDKICRSYKKNKNTTFKCYKLQNKKRLLARDYSD